MFTNKHTHSPITQRFPFQKRRALPDFPDAATLSLSLSRFDTQPFTLDATTPSTAGSFTTLASSRSSPSPALEASASSPTAAGLNQYGKRLRSPQVGRLELVPLSKTRSNRSTSNSSSQSSSEEEKENQSQSHHHHHHRRRQSETTSSPHCSPAPLHPPGPQKQTTAQVHPRLRPSMASAGPSAQGGSYFGLNLSSESAASAAPAAAAGTTPFFTPSAYPATPNPFGRPDQTHADNNNAGFAAALQRNNTLTLPSAKKPAPATTRVSPSQAGPSTPSVSAVNAAPSASSGATPFFSDLSLHSGHHQQQQQNQQESPKHQNHHHPHAALLRRTSSASAVPNPSAPPSLSLPALKMPSAGVNGNKRPSTASGAGASESASFPALAPADVQPSWFLDERQSTLVLDLRTHSAFLNHGTGRLRGSVNLCVPTTLLRRPNHSLTKLADTLPDKHHRDALLDVLNPDTPLKRVIALDQDSVVLAPSGPLCSILSKVARERGQAAAQQTKNNVPALQLFWVKGGMCALAKDSKVQRAGVLIPPGTEDDSDSHSNSEDSLSSLARTDSDASDRSSSSGTSVHSSDSGKSAKSADTATTTVPPILQVRSLPMAAFDNTSTQQYKNNGPPTSSARPASRQQVGPS